jgi:hypothetical protein
MSQCDEHGEPISLFCISPTCCWRETCLCPACLRSTHSHLPKSETIAVDRLDQLAQQLGVKGDVKPKSKILQEAVFNYFVVMKSEINTSIDAIFRVISSKLSYPYLASEGQLATFTKIRNKEYKKLNKK